MTVLAVTGAGGYLGGALVNDAAGAGRAVRPVVRRHVPWLAGEVCAVRSLEQDAAAAVVGAGTVVHLAGPNEVETAADPDGALAVTVSAARAVAEACAATGVDRLVYVSTVHVYGAALVPGASVDETTVPQPRHPYAIARLASEHTISARAGRTEVVVLRLSNSVGPPPDPSVDRWSLLVNDLCRQVAEKGRLQLLSTGHQWRDFVAMRDVTRVVLAAADGRVPAGTYNLASGRPMTVRQMASLVADAAAAAGLPRPETVFGPAGPSRPEEPFRLSVERLDRLGLVPATPLEDAVRDTLSFCLGPGRPAATRGGDGADR